MDRIFTINGYTSNSDSILYSISFNYQEVGTKNKVSDTYVFDEADAVSSAGKSEEEISEILQERISSEQIGLLEGKLSQLRESVTPDTPAEIDD